MSSRTTNAAADPTPDDVSDYYGLPCARFGQCVIPADQERDPAPTVYVSAHGGGEVDLSDLRLKLDVAEEYATRILNAVRWQRARDTEQRHTELNAMAAGNATTHTWGTTDTGSSECATCRSLVYSEEILRNGAVPLCGDRCPLSWHAITSNFGGEPRSATCFHCKTVYPTTVEDGAR